MIPCSKCGADNHLGAIFCRTCGCKLELGEFRPKTLNQQAGVVGVAHYLQLAWRIFIIGVLILVAGIFVGLFMTAPGYRPNTLSDADAAAALRQYQDLFIPKVKATTVTFTSEQAQAILNKELGLTKKEGDSGWALAPEELSIDFLASGYIRVVLLSKVKGKFSVYSTLIGSLEPVASGYEFRIVKAKMGKVGLPGEKFKEVILGRLAPVFADYPQFAALQALVSSVEVSAEALAVTIKPTAVPAPVRKPAGAAPRR